MKYIQQGLSAREETLRLREERAEELRIACQNAFLGTISKKDRASIIMELPLETVSYLSPFMLKSLHDLGYQTIGDLTRHYDSYMAWEENQKKVINLSVVTKHVMERTGLIKNYSVLDYETKKKESRYNG